MTSPSTTAPAPAHPAATATERIDRLRAAAHRIRHNALQMGEAGPGLHRPALGVADILAVAYTDQLRYRPEDPHWEDRDRFLLSIGHYAIALYAALAEAGTIPPRSSRPTARTSPGCRCRAWPPTHPGWRSPAAPSATDSP